MKKQTIIYLSLASLLAVASVAEELPNPFTPHVFIKQIQSMPVNSGDLVGGRGTLTTGEQVSVHPLKAFDIFQYSVKGIILSKDNSIVIVNAGPGKDYFVRKGDAIGKNKAILEEVLIDRIILIEDKKEVIIKVRNTEETSRYGY
jgi:Tfp pilus assembly protein PilP